MDVEDSHPEGGPEGSPEGGTEVGAETDGIPAVLMTRPLPAAPGVPDLVAQTVQVGFGVTALVVDIVLRSLGWAAAPTNASGQRVSPATSGQATDVVFGVAWTAVGWAGQVAGAMISVGGPLAGALTDPPLVPQRLRPSSVASGLARTWQRERPQAGVALDNAMAAAVPLSTSAILQWVDVDRLVRTVVDRLDLQALVTTALADLDLDAVVSEALAQIDVAAVADAAVQRIDLTQLVIDRVDLGAVVTAALDEIDLDQIVMQRVDVLGLADYVVQGIDLPEIIRMSTGSVASEAVRSVRMQGVDADRAVAGIVDRIILRRRGRVTDAPGDPESLAAPADDRVEQ